ncbi:MAG: type II toxin-antitoxin system HicA family toxin [Thermoleophilia bacterium]|nr:type II toxin-antitoxin system HicA family toxin [Thermoleophilia bacterium]
MPMTYRQVRAALVLAGWTKVPQRGSHEKWRSPDGATHVVVAGRNSRTVHAGMLASMRRRTGLDHLR